MTDAQKVDALRLSASVTRVADPALAWRPDVIPTALSISVRLGDPDIAARDAPLSLLIPSFLLSEISRAFQIGFVIYLPFLVIDLVVASVLISMGMFMLPPVMISTPFKILLFVLVDGWRLVCESLVTSFIT